MIFWTDTGSNKIEQARLDGSGQITVLSGELDEPRDITVDPVEKWVVYTIWDQCLSVCL